MRGKLGFAILPLLAVSGALYAHHSFPAVYDAKARKTISGVVTQMLYQNPHARLYLRVTNDDGTEDIWELETQNTSFLRRGGWLPNSVQPGDRLTIEGNVAYKIEKRLYVQVVTQENGHVLWVQDPAPLREEGYQPTESPRSSK
jgi:Family of unknown function (DUF6152)